MELSFSRTDFDVLGDIDVALAFGVIWDDDPSGFGLHLDFSSVVGVFFISSTTVSCISR